ncbi:hypothetical protein FQZ97_840970 [compost metagenome]
MILDLRQAQRRVDGHRDAAGQQDSEEAQQEIATGRQHQRHGLSGAQATPLQPRRNPPGFAQQVAVADVLRPVVVTQQAHVDVPWLMLRMPVQYIDQGACGIRRQLLEAAGRNGIHHGGRLARPAGSTAAQNLQHVCRRAGRGEQLLRQAHSERLLDPRPEFDPGQAVHAQVAVQHAVQADAQSRRRLWAQLGHGALDDAEQFFRVLIEARIGAGFHRRMRHRRPSSGKILDLSDYAPIQALASLQASRAVLQGLTLGQPGKAKAPETPGESGAQVLGWKGRYRSPSNSLTRQPAKSFSPSSSDWPRVLYIDTTTPPISRPRVTLREITAGILPIMPTRKIFAPMNTSTRARAYFR